MIENEIERFREHEKEFKMKQYSQRALMQDQDKGNFVDGQRVWYSGDSSGCYSSDGMGGSSDFVESGSDFGSDQGGLQ